MNVTDFDFLYCGKFNNVKTEYIGQISYKDNVFIPELVSTQPGRLFGRYKKFYGINIEELIKMVKYQRYTMIILFNLMLLLIILRTI